MAGETAIVLPRSDYRWTGLTLVTSSVPAAKPKATAPASGTQEFLLPTASGDASKVLRVYPVISSALSTGMKMRIVSWNGMQSPGGDTSYWPTVLAEYTLSFTSGTKPSISIDGTTVYTFNSAAVARQVPAYNANWHFSPGAATAASEDSALCVVDTIGGRYITLQFAASVGYMGALWAWS